MWAKNPMPGRQCLARQSDVATCRGDTQQRRVERRRCIKVNQRADSAWLRRGGAGHQRATDAIGLFIVGEHRAFGWPHGFTAHAAAQDGFVKGLRLTQPGSRNFKPAGIF